MKVELNVKDLLSKLNLASAALSSKGFYPVLTHFCFKEDCVIAYNDRHAIEVGFDTGLKCCLPGVLLLKLLGSLSGETAVFSLKEGTVHITSGRSKLKLPYLPESEFDFEYPDTSSYLSTFTVDSDFIEGLSKCLISSGNDPTHPAQMGITLEVTKEDGNYACLYSTDNFSISRYDLQECPGRLPGEAPVILPTFLCKQILEMEKHFPDEEIEIHLMDDAVVVEFGDKVYLFSKLIADSEPLDFEKVIGANINEEEIDYALKSSKYLKEALGRALILLGGAQDKDKVSKFSTSGKDLSITTRTSNGEGKDVVRFPKDMDENEISLDVELVSRAIDLAPNLYVSNKVLLLTDGGAFVHLISRIEH